MKRARRLFGMMAVALVLTSLFVIGCGSSPTGSLITGDDDGVFVRPGNAGDSGSSLDDKNSDKQE